MSFRPIDKVKLFESLGLLTSSEPELPVLVEPEESAYPLKHRMDQQSSASGKVTSLPIESVWTTLAKNNLGFTAPVRHMSDAPECLQGQYWGNNAQG